MHHKCSGSDDLAQFWCCVPLWVIIAQLRELLIVLSRRVEEQTVSRPGFGYRGRSVEYDGSEGDDDWGRRTVRAFGVEPLQVMT
jgi:hypothetical protein